MKRFFYLFFFVALCFLNANSQEIVLNGTFQGDNLFVKNPFSPSGVGFCVYEVDVNGLTSTDEINSSAFEIDLSVYGFKIGQEVNVEIKYKENCLPIVLNPEVLNSRATFEVTSIEVSDNKIQWTTVKEAGVLPFIVEQYRWNKWIEVGRVNGKGISGENKYSSPVRLHSGDNRFRVKQVDYRGKPKYSQEITFTSTKPKVSFMPTRVEDVITFSAPTMFEIYDEFGGIVFKGFGESIKVNGLQKGKYYLNFDDKLGSFIKK